MKEALRVAIKPLHVASKRTSTSSGNSYDERQCHKCSSKRLRESWPRRRRFQRKPLSSMMGFLKIKAAIGSNVALLWLVLLAWDIAGNSGGLVRRCRCVAAGVSM
eukprot:scaffold593220_cov56-Prasinocladus_malaysianus.AAC.1